MGISCIFLRNSVKQLLSFWIGLSYNEYFLLMASKSMLGGSLLLNNTGKCLSTMLLPTWILTENPRSFEKESELTGEKKNSASHWHLSLEKLLFSHPKWKFTVPQNSKKRKKKQKKKQLDLCYQCLFYVEQYANTKELRARTVVLCSFSSGNAMRKWPKHVESFPLVA